LGEFNRRKQFKEEEMRKKLEQSLSCKIVEKISFDQLEPYDREDLPKFAWKIGIFCLKCSTYKGYFYIARALPYETRLEWCPRCQMHTIHTFHIVGRVKVN